MKKRMTMGMMAIVLPMMILAQSSSKKGSKTTSSNEERPALQNNQDCTKELLAKKPGTWKQGMKGSVSNVAASDLAKERSVLDRIHKMIASAYDPIGCEVNHSMVYGKPPGAAGWLADPYYHSLYILRYLCDPTDKTGKKYYVDYATPTTVNITANAIYWLNTLYACALPEDDMRGYLKLKTRPQKRDGFYFMGAEVVGDAGQKYQIKEYRWLITYGDTLPFSYISRKEYLMIQAGRLEQRMKESPGEKKYYQGFLDNINAYLKKPAEELEKEAICLWNEEERFENFVPEGTLGSFIAVKPNLAYYHRKLPLSSPQFFTVVYKLSEGDPVFEENIAAIQKAMDLKALRDMLGK